MNGRAPVLLMIDDKEENLFILKQILRQYLRHCQILTSTSAYEGFEMAASQEVDAALIDVQMREISGIELCRRLKSAPHTRHIPILLLTAHRSCSHVNIEGLEAGADDFITRPINNAELIARIKVMLRMKRAEDTLRKTNAALETRVEERSQQLLENREWLQRAVLESPYPSMVYTETGHILFVNRIWEELTGYPLKTIDSLAVFSQKVLQLDNPCKTDCAECFPGKKTVLSERTIHTKWGRQLTWEISTSPLGSRPDGQKLFIFIGTDVTERKQNEKALKNYEKVVESSDDVIAIIDRNYRYTLVNRSFLRYYNLVRPQVIGYTVEEVVGPALFENQVRSHLDQCFQGKLISYEADRHFARYGYRNLLVKYYPLKRQDGSIHEIAIILRDTTKRKMAEDHLLKALNDAEISRDNIDAILRSVSDGLLVTDGNGRIILKNKAAFDYLGIEKNKDAAHLTDVLQLKAQLQDHIINYLTTEDQAPPFDFEIPQEPGLPPRTLQARTSSVINKQNRRIGTITILQDVTRERDINRLKNEFISTAAHELRTPLTAILGYAELVLNHPLEKAQQEEFLQCICDKAEVLEKIIDELLNLERIDSGRVIYLEKNHVDIDRLIRETVNQYEREFPSYSFHLTLPERPTRLFIDRIKITQVLENFLSNAVKYSPEAGGIEICGRWIEKHFELSVTDQGIGMSKEQQSRAFEKFYRADSSNTAVGGLGLGLTIARNIAEAHNGRIGIESTPGQGTRIWFKIPGKDLLTFASGFTAEEPVQTSLCP